MPGRLNAKLLSARLKAACHEPPNGYIDLNEVEEVLAECMRLGLLPVIIDPETETVEPVEGGHR